MRAPQSDKSDKSDRSDRSDGGSPIAISMRLTLYALALWLAAGCGRRPPGAITADFYPVGICAAYEATNLPAVREAGFNLVLGTGQREYLDAARSNHLAVLLGVPRKGEGLARLDRHPAVWAWLLADEPEMKGVAPEQVEAEWRQLRAAGVRKPTLVIHFKGHAAADYARLGDLTACDRYPIPWLPLCSFGQHLRQTRLGIGPEKPLLAIIQAFDWRYYREQLPTEDASRLRPPTYEEMRCMTYDAVAHGANGLLFYGHDDGPGRWRMSEHAETWTALRRIVREVNARRPLFQGRRVWWDKQHRWQDPTRQYNAALESSLDAVLLSVQPGNATVPAGHYILAVNNTPETQVYGFTPPGQWGAGGGEQGAASGRPEAGGNGEASEWSAPREAGLAVLGEDRRVAVEGGWATDSFGPYAVHVYGPLGTNRPGSTSGLGQRPGGPVAEGALAR